MKVNQFSGRSAWLRRCDLEVAFACLRDNLLDEDLDGRLWLAQELISSVVGQDPDALVSETTPLSPKELANTINASTFLDSHLGKSAASGSVVWCPILPEQIEVAETVRQLAAICATRILPIDDLAIAENAADLGAQTDIDDE